MGEKGNVAAAAGGAIGAGSAAGAAGEALIERTTTRTTETVVGAGEDYVGSVREKVIESAADHTIAEGRERLRRPGGEEPGDPPDGAADGVDPTPPDQD